MYDMIYGMYMVNQFIPTISAGTVVSTFVAAGCNKTYAGGVIFVTTFPPRNERLETAVTVSVMVICALTGYNQSQMPDIILTHKTFNLNKIYRLQNKLPIPFPCGTCSILLR